MITFILINIFLGITFFLFNIALKTKKGMNLFWLRTAQSLVLLSIILPFGFQFLPAKKITPTEVPTIVENAEILPIKKTQEKTVILIKETQKQIQQIDQKININFIFLFRTFYLIGLAFFIARALYNYYKIKVLLNESTLLKQFKKLKIVVSADVLVPFSVRTLTRYWVIFPISSLENKRDAEIILQHELQHHRQGDTSWALLIEVLHAIFYFNPAMSLWKNCIIELQEFSCDEALIGLKNVSSREYGSCLLRVAETALLNRHMYAGTTSMAQVFKNSKHFKAFLLRRIEMIMQKELQEKKSKRNWISICTGLLLIFITTTLSYAATKIIQKDPNAINSGKIVVDAEIQKIADEKLEKALKDPMFTAGFVIVSDPISGKILAVANTDKTGKLKGHWALSQSFAQASLGKTFIIAEALEKNITTPEDTHNCENGKYVYKGKTYYEWKKEGFDKLSTTQTLAVSSNLCSIKIAEKLGDAGIKSLSSKFGFGEESIIKDFPEAKVGDPVTINEQFIPRASMGYAFRSSPLEVVQGFGAVINGGKLMKPIMANENSSEVIRHVLSAENSQKMKTILEEVVKSGTAKDTASSRFYTTAGKTASATIDTFLSDNLKGNERPNFAAFIGFAPVKNPRVEIFVGLVKADSKNSGAHGGAHAAPVFKDVAENVLAHMKVAPDKI